MVFFKAIVVICFMSSPSGPPVCTEFQDTRGHKMYGDGGHYKTELACGNRTRRMEFEIKKLITATIGPVLTSKRICKEVEPGLGV